MGKLIEREKENYITMLFEVKAFCIIPFKNMI
jgi:hypothetical protein